MYQYVAYCAAIGPHGDFLQMAMQALIHCLLNIVSGSDWTDRPAYQCVALLGQTHGAQGCLCRLNSVFVVFWGVVTPVDIGTQSCMKVDDFISCKDGWQCILLRNEATSYMLASTLIKPCLHTCSSAHTCGT